MEIRADAHIAFPRETVFRTYRDRLPELVPHLPNIKSIAVQERKEEAGKVELVNLWEAKGDIPKIAQSVIKPEMAAWLDYASWDEGAYACDWRVETRVFSEHVRCGGRNEYESNGDGTILHIRGQLDIDLKGIPGVPRLIAGKVTPIVEKFIVDLLTPNLTSVAAGLEAFLQAEAAR